MGGKSVETSSRRSTRRSGRQKSNQFYMVYPNGFDSQLHSRMNCTCLQENWKELRPHPVELGPDGSVPNLLRQRVTLLREGGIGTIQEQNGRTLKLDMDIITANATANAQGDQPPPLRVADVSEILIVPERYDACIFCEVNEDDENAVLCDCCDIAAHIYCLKPPLKSIPEGSWFCKRCQRERKRWLAELNSSSSAAAAKATDDSSKA